MAALIDLQMPKSVEHILTSVEKMDRLIGGLLRLSSLSRARLEPEPLDLADYLFQYPPVPAQLHGQDFA